MKIRNYITSTVVFLLIFILNVNAQNPFEQYNYKPKVATLSQGEYNEFHDQDTLVQIGSVILNTKTQEIVAFVKKDTLYSEATLEPDIVSRWLSPDPLAEKYTSWSPYNYVTNNPLNYIDPDGRSGVPVYDKENNRIVVNSKIYFYGEGSAELAQAVAQNMQNAWNEANGTGTLIDENGDFIELPVHFNITGEFVSEEQAVELANGNTSSENNFIRIINGSTKRNSSYMVTISTKLGGNSGVFQMKDLLGGKTIAAHEKGHGYGYYNKNQRNKTGIKARGMPGPEHNNNPSDGIPTVMTQGNVIADPQYMTGNKLDSRKVHRSSQDVSNLRIKVNINSSNNYVGKPNNIIFDKNENRIN